MASWYSLQAIPTGLRILGTGVVIIGAVLSVTLHEWGHAIVALRGGDHTVVKKGYLTLDPRKYVDPLLSIAMPVVSCSWAGCLCPVGRSGSRSTGCVGAVGAVRCHWPGW